jgi:hypothetical protein
MITPPRRQLVIARFAEKKSSTSRSSQRSHSDIVWSRHICQSCPQTPYYSGHICENSCI